MEISNLIAAANPLGRQIDISWQLDVREESVGIKLARDDKDFPQAPDKSIVYDSEAFEYDLESRTVQQLEEEMVETASYFIGNVLVKRVYHYFTLDSGNFIRTVITIFDRGLEEEEVYYYSLFLKQNGIYKTSGILQTTAFSTAIYNYSAQLYDHLPGIYKKYDRDGILKRFLEIFGHQFDLMQSFTRVLKDLYDIDKCPSDFLPLLSHHIGWELDYSRNVPTQRNTLKGAVQIQKKTGTIKAIEAYVRTMTSCKCKVREFVHNIFRSNAPEEMYFEDGRCVISRSKTVDTSDKEYPDKDSLENMKTYQDTLHYTFDTEKEQEDWYSNDTIGLFVINTPETTELTRLEDSFYKFLPLNVRALIVTGGIIGDMFHEKVDLVGKTTDTVSDTLI